MCINCITIELSGKVDGLEPELLRVAKLIHSGKLKPGDIDAGMVKKIAGQLMNGVFKGYGKDFDSKGLTDSERTFMGKLQENIYVFSGFKNYHQLAETTLLLKTDDGKIRPFNDFLNDVKQVNETYNEVYLNAEYGNAIASGQMAQSWQDFENNGVSMLTYQTAGDDRVRDEHAILEGATYPIDDPFWSEFYPPNGWGCRCDVSPSISDKADRIAKNELPDIPDMFRNNVGQSGIVFPETHPYFDVAKEIGTKIIEQVDDILPAEPASEFMPENITSYEKSAGIEIDKEIFNYLSEPTKFTQQKGGAYYNSNSKVVNIPNDERRQKSKWVAESTVYHEFGHAADFQNDFQKLDSVKEMMSTYKAKYKNDFADLTSKLLAEGRVAFKSGDFDTAEQTTSVLDTIMSLDKRYGAGHGYKVTYGGKRMDYFNVPGMKEAEFIAHAFENRFVGNPLFKKHMPDLYDDMIELTKKFKPK